MHSLPGLPPRAEGKIRLEWAKDLSRGTYGKVNWDKATRVMRAGLMDVLLGGIDAIGDVDTLRGKKYNAKNRKARK